MGGFKAEPLVEPVRCCPGPVRRELDQFCTASTPFGDRPGDHGAAQSVAAKIGTDADRFNLQPCSPSSGESGNEGQLHGGNHFIFGRDDGDKELGRIGVNGLEGKVVGIPVRDRTRLDRGPELVGRQKPTIGPTSDASACLKVNGPPGNSSSARVISPVFQPNAAPTLPSDPVGWSGSCDAAAVLEGIPVPGGRPSSLRCGGLLR